MCPQYGYDWYNLTNLKAWLKLKGPFLVGQRISAFEKLVMEHYIPLDHHIFFQFVSCHYGWIPIPWSLAFLEGGAPFWVSSTLRFWPPSIPIAAMATVRQRIAWLVLHLVAEGLACYGVSMLKDPRIVPKFPRRTVSESVGMDGSVSSWVAQGWMDGLQQTCPKFLGPGSVAML